jgi:hypothetical protein
LRGFVHDPGLADANGISPDYGVVDAHAHVAPMIDTDQYMGWLRGQVQAAGVRITQRRIEGSPGRPGGATASGVRRRRDRQLHRPRRGGGARLADVPAARRARARDQRRSADAEGDAGALEPVRAGLRPCRTGNVCVEREDATAIVHNYGHGGSGFSLSWGVRARSPRPSCGRPAR